MIPVDPKTNAYVAELVRRLAPPRPARRKGPATPEERRAQWREARARYVAAHPEKVRQQHEKYVAAHPEKVREAQERCNARRRKPSRKLVPIYPAAGTKRDIKEQKRRARLASEAYLRELGVPY